MTLATIREANLVPRSGGATIVMERFFEAGEGAKAV